MPKEQVSWTIDKEICEWIESTRGLVNASTFVNDKLKKAMMRDKGAKKQ